MIKLCIVHSNEEVQVESNCKVMDIAKNYEKDFNHSIYGAIVDHKLRDLNYIIRKDSTVEFFTSETPDGQRFYQRTISFIYIIAVKKLFRNCKVTVEHTLNGGLYCEVHHGRTLTVEDVRQIEKEMKEIIKQDLPIMREVVSREEAVEIFQKNGLYDKAELLRYRTSDKASVYSLLGHLNYFYGMMLPRTGHIESFHLCYYEPGLIIFTSKEDQIQCDQRKLFEAFREFEKWGDLIGINTVASLNKKIINGDMKNIILMAEALHEKKLSQLADQITSSIPLKKLLLIAGPSSAGKTTFANRLAIELRVNGLIPVTISMDDFYRNRVDSPRLADGTYDFESVETLDLTLFNQTMLELVKGNTVEIPYYNFQTGEREWRKNLIQLEENQVVIVEGLHGLNPVLSQFIPNELKFKIYINALTHLNYDDHNRIPTADYRLIRRMVRDNQFRGTNATITLEQWKNVRAGEDQYIYPYQENADYIFNTSLVYEMTILKAIALPLLNEIAQDTEEYIEASRLKNFLNYFVDGDEKYVPYNSILGEFIGKSCFL